MSNFAKQYRRVPLALVTCTAIAAMTWLASSRCLADVALDDEFGKQASWKSPSTAEVKTQLTAWLAQQKPDAAVQKQIDSMWAGDLPPAQLLEQTVATVALVDAPAKELAQL